MKTISRYIMTLALLITAVGGAWAEDEVLLTTVTATSQTTYSQSPDGIVTVALSGIDNYIEGFGWVRTGGGTATVTVEANEGYTITRCVFKQNADNYPNRVIEDDLAPFVMTINGGGMFAVPSSFVEASDGQRKVTDMDGLTVIEVYGAAAPAEPDVEVTTNAASEGATFTEASFEMPAFDATAEYELVRDMSVQMTAQVGDGTQEQPRYRVKKDGNNKFIPADMEMAAVPALFTVNDAIEQKALTQTQDYIVQIYAIDAEGQPTGDPMTFATFTFEPGIYAVKAVAADGSDYDGETALSNTFKLFQGYEVEVAAGEFATYYKDENIYEEEDDAELYTIQSVSADQVTLSNVRDLVPANTAMLVYNKGQETKTFLLIPTEDEPVSFMSYMHFIGTLTGTTIAASTASQTNYALNGKQFVYVKNAIAIGANKAYLSIPATISNARAVNIVFSDATGVNGVIGVKEVNDGSWYDLNGRKLDKMPTKKGVYLFNGRKVVVK